MGEAIPELEGTTQKTLPGMIGFYTLLNWEKISIILSKISSLEFVLNTHQLPFRVAKLETQSYFKFERWWLETKGFNEKFKVWWYSIIINRRPIIF